MPHILLSGATGFIGKKLVRLLLSQAEPPKLTVLIRKESDKKVLGNVVQYCFWNVEKGSIQKECIQDVDTVIHLAGANIAAKKWTEKRKKLLLSSRVATGNLLQEWILSGNNQVKNFISASAIGWYGEGALGQEFDESDPAANDFLGKVCAQWEQSTAALQAAGIRTVYIRTGLVMDKTGGMWQKLLPAFKWYVAPIFGDGTQIFSWISLWDLLAIYQKSVVDQSMVGAYNAVAPNPLSQKILTQQLAVVEHKHFISLPIRGTFLKMILGELSVELLKSAHVCADKILETGFHFQHPTVTSLTSS